jgi:hypothetical protein
MADSARSKRHPGSAMSTTEARPSRPDDNDVDLRRPESEAMMAAFTKRQIRIIRRAYGDDVAASLAEQLPSTHIDLDDASNLELLFRLGLSRDQLFDVLGGEA